MTRRPVESTQNAVSLFPFLAVLLCTMGSLILMLIVIARQARDEAENARAGAATAAKADTTKLDERRDELNWEIERLAESRKKTADQLAEQRANLSHLEEHAQRLRSEIAELDDASKLLGKKTELDDEARAKLVAELEEIRRRATEIEAKMAEALAKGKRPPAFAVIPFDGENGTRRRPIYIECRDDSIILQPEGIIFKETDFAGSLGPSNPLAACVRIVAEHHARTASLETAAQPYPLLLVRPGGIGAYYAARAAMSSWDSEFGYELIDADWPLEFPPPDPNLTQLLARAQEEARRRQTLIARAAPTLRGDAPPTFQMKPEDAGQSGGPGGRYAGRGGAPSNASANGAAVGGPTASGGGSGGSGYGPSGVAQRDQNRYADATGSYGPAGANGSGGNGNGGIGGEAGATGAANGYGLPGTAGSANGPGGGANGAPGSGAEGPQLFAPGVGTPGSPGAGMPGNGAQASGMSGTPANGVADGGMTGQAGGGAGSNTFGTPNFEQPPGTGSGNNSAGGGNANGIANAAGTNNVATANGAPSANGGEGGPNGGSSSPAGAPSGAGSATGPVGTSQSASTGGSAAGGQVGSAAGAGGGSAASAGGGGSSGSAGGMPSLNFGDAPSAGAPPNGAPPNDAPQNVQGGSNRRLESLARQRGENWGIPESAKKATPLTRPVQIYCANDRITVLSDRGIPDRQINLGPRTEDSVDELVSTVWSQIEAWGIAGRGMYWRPVLSVHVAPDGTARFDELKTLLSGSGLEVTGKPIVVSNSTSAGPRR